jgi:S1-C subfamily serine protease
MTVRILFAAVLCFLASTVSAQTKTMLIQRDGHGSTHIMTGEPFMLKEISAILIADSNGLRVVNVMPAERRPAAYKDVDLRTDDIVSLVNGKRTPGVKAIQEVYDGLKTGEDFTMGVRRGDERLLVTVKKADPSSLPQVKMKVIHQGENTETFPAVGVTIEKRGKALFISELLPGETAVHSLDVKKGDQVVSINGELCQTLADYGNIFDNVEVGHQVTWILKRGGGEHSVSFNRPKPMMIMKKEGSVH